MCVLYKLSFTFRDIMLYVLLWECVLRAPTASVVCCNFEVTCCVRNIFNFVNITELVTVAYPPDDYMPMQPNLSVPLNFCVSQKLVRKISG